MKDILRYILVRVLAVIYPHGKDCYVSSHTLLFQQDGAPAQYQTNYELSELRDKSNGIHF